MIRYQADKETRILYEDNPRTPEQYSRLFLKPPILPFAEAFGLPGTLARRFSTRRPATVGPRTALSQVVIRNTHSLRHTEKKSSDMSMGRSQTVHLGPRIQTLAPRRLDRIHMEQDLADVWTRDLLTYPGMSSRAESQIRASANTVMRRLSRATSNSFGKRSGSFTSRLEEAIDDESPESSPKLDYCRALVPVVESPRGPSIVTHDGFPEPKSRTTSKELKACIDAAKPENIAPVGADNDALQSSEKDKQPRHLRKRLNSSLSLIRTMSIEGMKAVFNYGQKDSPSPRRSVEL